MALTDDQNMALIRQANAEGRGKTTLLRQALYEYFAKRGLIFPKRIMRKKNGETVETY